MYDINIFKNVRVIWSMINLYYFSLSVPKYKHICKSLLLEKAYN